ncbi:Na+/H+ antiporter [Nocardioides taihuensis]|uniref:Na+/H+ antiporter n=1 Tax=Nocardioides taihuensis TaxID=1835606 RepID=A0ABW0BIC5_9ACTN
MELALFIVALAVGVLVGSAVAARLDVPAPLLLIAAGIVASYAPGVPEVHLEPEVVLLGLLPPLLYAASISTSLIDFNANRRAILLLSVGLVAFTTLGVGVVVHAVLPEISWPIAFAIGAVVAPPDAVAATAIGRRIGLPRRLVTILEGESLLNDATALVALRTALAATVGVTALEVGLDFLLAAGGGVLAGLLTFVVVAKARHRIQDPVFDTAVSFVVPFAAYLLAEEFHASGVVAVVVAGLLLGHKAPIIQTAQSRLAERTIWRTISWVLENTVFLLIGLQAQWLFADVAESDVPAATIALTCVATLVAVVVLRMVWVFFARYLLVRPGPDPETGHHPSWRYTFLLGWAGMRGVVTLAAAFVIPVDVPDREILLLVAFTVVAGTLFLQGLTLPWVARRLQVPPPDPAADALARATLLHQATEAGLAVLDERLEEAGADGDPHDVGGTIRRRIEQRNFAVWEQLGDPDGDHETPTQTYARLRLEMLEAERGKVLDVRSEGNVPHEVVSEVLAMLDVEESMLDVVTSNEDGRVGAGRRAARNVGGLCDDLTDDTPAAEPRTPGECEDCVAEGTQWVHLRVCIACGKVGCCDSSPERHATRHFHREGHPVIQSGEQGEDWRWCFVHHLTG